LNIHHILFSNDIYIIALFFTTLGFTTLYFGITKKPLKSLIWILSKRTHISIQTRIVECNIFEREGVSQLNDSRGKSQFFPEIKLEFSYNGAHYSSIMALTRFGYEDLSKALSHLTKIAPLQCIKYVQTYEEYIYNSMVPIFTQIKINENPEQKNFITLFINPKKPKDNESLYNTYIWQDWLPLCIFAPMPIMVFLAMPHLNEIFFSKISIVASISTVVWSIFVYFLSASLITHLSKIFSKNSISKIGRFQIMIDNKYDGTQIEPFLEKK
jgi:hypothetical protein